MQIRRTIHSKTRKPRRILAHDILSFNLGIFKGDGTTSAALTKNKLPLGGGTLIEFDIKAFKLTEASSILHVGTEPLIKYQEGGQPTSYQNATSPFSIQLDNRVMPQNN